MRRRRSIQWVEEDELGSEVILMQNHPDDYFESEAEDRENSTEQAQEVSAAERDVPALCSRCGKFPQSTRKGVRKGLCCNRCPHHGPWCSGHASPPESTRVQSKAESEAVEQPCTRHHISKKRAKVEIQDHAQLPSPAEGTSSDESANTHTLANECQSLQNLSESSSGTIERASASVVSERARKLLVPKAAARPPMGLLQRMAQRRQGEASFQPDGVPLPVGTNCRFTEVIATPHTVEEHVCLQCADQAAMETQGETVATRADEVSESSAMVTSPNSTPATETTSFSSDVMSTEVGDQDATSNAKQTEEPILGNSQNTSFAVSKTSARRMGLFENIVARKLGKDYQLRPNKMEHNAGHAASKLAFASSNILDRENQFLPNKIGYCAGHVKLQAVAASPNKHAPCCQRTPLGSIDMNALRF